MEAGLDMGAPFAGKAKDREYRDKNNETLRLFNEYQMRDWDRYRELVRQQISSPFDQLFGWLR